LAASPSGNERLYPWQKVSVPLFSAAPLFFSSQKGPHPKRWKFVLWRANHLLSSPMHTQLSTFLHVQDLDSRQLLFARLRKIGFQLPSAATWRSFGDWSLAISNIQPWERSEIFEKHLTLTKYSFQFRCFITCSL
jgi:hypothetical protein